MKSVSLSSRLQATWQGLSARDRRILALAAPVIVVLVIYLALVAPLQQQRAAAWAQVAQYKQDYHWLREQPPARGTACASGVGAEAASAPAELLRDRLAALGLADAAVTAAGDGQWDITIPAAPGQPVLQFVDAMACTGFIPLAVNLQPVADVPGAVAADLSLLAAGERGEAVP